MTSLLSAPPITALGFMSGTSLDGIDAAFLKTDGVSISEFGPSAYRPYLKDEKEILLSLIHISDPRDQRGSRMPSSA